MKKYFSFIFFSLLSTCMLSQNWEILNPEVTSYYSHSDSLRLSNTINIDSVITNGVTQNYYISNMYKVCDTCDFNPQNEVIIHRYAKEFLGFGVLYDSINYSYVIEGDTLFSQAGVGEIWQFNDDLNATISNAYSDTVFGVLDSLKTITLSSNDTIILSKNYGLIRYPDFENEGKYYELKGFHDNEWYYGEVFPNFWSIYDFAVGDEYCYSRRSAGNNMSNEVRKQVKIISNQTIFETEFMYETTFIGHSSTDYADDSGTSYNYNSGANTQNNGANLTINSYENFEGIQFKNYWIGEEVNQTLFQSQGTSETVSSFRVTRNWHTDVLGYRKIIRHFYPLGDSLLRYVGNCGYESSSECNFPETVIEFSNHFGRIFFEQNEGLALFQARLEGAVVSGDTIGNFCNFPFDLGIESHSINPLSIHPNPATSQITIEGNYETLEIYSQKGQLVMIIEEPKNIIDVSALASGIYFLKATYEEKLYANKLIIE